MKIFTRLRERKKATMQPDVRWSMLGILLTSGAYAAVGSYCINYWGFAPIISIQALPVFIVTSMLFVGFMLFISFVQWWWLYLLLEMCAHKIQKDKSFLLLTLMKNEKFLKGALVAFSILCWFLILIIKLSIDTEGAGWILFKWSILTLILVFVPYVLLALLDESKTLRDFKMVTCLSIILFSIILIFSSSLSKDYIVIPNMVERALQVSKTGGGVTVTVNSMDLKGTPIRGQLIFYDGVTAWVYSVDEIIETRVKSITYGNEYDSDIKALKHADNNSYKEITEILNNKLPVKVDYLVLYGSTEGDKSDFHSDIDLVISAPNMENKEWKVLKEELIALLPEKNPHFLKWEDLMISQKREICRTGKVLFKRE